MDTTTTRPRSGNFGHNGYRARCWYLTALGEAAVGPAPTAIRLVDASPGHRRAVDALLARHGATR